MGQQKMLLGEIVPIKSGGSRGDSVKVYSNKPRCFIGRYSDKPRCFIGRYEPARRDHHAEVIFDAATKQARFR